MEINNENLIFPISIPQDSIKIDDIYEEVFLLFTEGRPLEWQHNRVVTQKKDYVEVLINGCYLNFFYQYNQYYLFYNFFSEY